MSPLDALTLLVFFLFAVAVCPGVPLPPSGRVLREAGLPADPLLPGRLLPLRHRPRRWVVVSASPNQPPHSRALNAQSWALSVFFNIFNNKKNDQVPSSANARARAQISARVVSRAGHLPLAVLR